MCAQEEPLRVCELGCGCSHLAPMLRDAGVGISGGIPVLCQLAAMEVTVIGVDFSQEASDEAHITSCITT